MFKKNKKVFVTKEILKLAHEWGKCEKRKYGTMRWGETFITFKEAKNG